MEEDTDTDTVIGLDIRGQIFYCNKSKLLYVNKGCSYFSARFREDSMLDAGLDRVDDEGRDIYKLDRDPSTFKYIMEYIRTDQKPKGIGAYEMNKQLWSFVRDEAIYFGLDSLVQLMRITFTCSPEADGDKGIMYWLGTKKGTSDYTNPHSSGDVAISGWFEEERFNRSMKEKDKELTVQYRPNPEGDEMITTLEEMKYSDYATQEKEEHIRDIFACNYGAMMGCSLSSGQSMNLQLLNGVAVSPTHYSIRHGGCYGMSGDWNLEASADGTTWDIIHEARGRQSKLYGNSNVYSSREELVRIIDMGVDNRKDAVCEYMEENHRQTWQVINTTGKFYTHFRLLSIEISVDESVDEDDDEWREDCLHGIGFEVYGDVYEEWRDESKIQIEQLENQNEEVKGQIEKLQTHIQKLQTQNEALLSENDSLKARVRQLENKRSAAVACLLEDR